MKKEKHQQPEQAQETTQETKKPPQSPPASGLEGMDIPPDQIKRPTEVVELPPQPKELKDAQALLGKPVRASIKSHQMTVFLTEYDESNQTYSGIGIRNVSMNAGDTLPHFESVQGLRRYPYAERPDYAFQFVTPGEDEAPIINIAQKNSVRPRGGEQAGDQGEQGSNQG